MNRIRKYFGKCFVFIQDSERFMLKEVNLHSICNFNLLQFSAMVRPREVWLFLVFVVLALWEQSWQSYSNELVDIHVPTGSSYDKIVQSPGCPTCATMPIAPQKADFLRVCIAKTEHRPPQYIKNNPKCQLNQRFTANWRAEDCLVQLSVSNDGPSDLEAS